MAKNNVSYVFKVLRRTSYGLFSATVDSSQRYAHTKYQKGVWVKPRIGKSFAFDSKDAAEAFVKEAHPGPYCEIWLAEARNVKQVPGLRVPLTFLSKRELELFWKKGVVIGGVDVPKGTVICDAIKLVRPVARYRCRVRGDRIEVVELDCLDYGDAGRQNNAREV